MSIFANGTACWEIIEVLPDNKGIKFTNHFEFTGIFGGALALLTRKMLKEGMELENESLREFVEM